MEDRLDRDREAFEQALPGLLETHRSRFALFSGGELIDLFSTYDEAYSNALQQFGSDGIFLIQKITEEKPEEISIAWEAGVVFG